MKFLKKFNENLDELEIQHLCDDYLAYLTDNDFQVQVYESYDFDDTLEIFLCRNSVDGDTPVFKWSEIKDRFIPFYNIISNRYKVYSISNYKLVADTVTFKLEWAGGQYPVNYYDTRNILIDNIRDITIYGIKFLIKSS